MAFIKDDSPEDPEEAPNEDELEDEIDASDLVGEDLLTPALLEEVVQYTLDWSVQSLLERIGTTFDISPSFQRRDAWTPQRKSLYIESLMLGLPVPQVVLAEGEAKGEFLVLDGKQRLITLKQFAAPGNAFKPLRLRQLDFLHPLEGLTFADMQETLFGREYAESLLAQPVRTIVVRNWRSPSVLYQIFVRLNQNSVPLSPQELRQALHPGPFTRWVDERSRSSDALHRARRTHGPDFRMRDAEMLLRFVALSWRLSEYAGNLREFLDDTCRAGNAAWEDDKARFESLAERCEDAIEIAEAAFGDDAFKRYDGERYVRRFNIAVFDALALVFASSGLSVRDLTAGKAAELHRAFEQLCSENDWFQESLISTTKTPRNTFGRIAMWGEAVASVLGTPVPLADEARGLLNSVG